MVLLMKKIFFLSLLLGGFMFAANAHALPEDRPAVITAEQLKTIVDTARYPHLLIDARTAGEYKEVHIKGAINMPVDKFEEDLGLLPTDKSARLIFYCNGVK
jgi:3-mercaptopyruvate sulfurtransferase SseA